MLYAYLLTRLITRIHSALYNWSNNGIFAWIIPNKFLIAQYAQETLNMLCKKNFLYCSIDVSSVNTFERASVYPIIILGHNNVDFKKYFISVQEDLGLKKLKKFKKLIYINIKHLKKVA